MSMLWMLLCIGGAFGPIANAAHVGGFLAGMVIGARTAIRKKIIGPGRA
jgi:membrane associated rhomboid family serine protease